MPRKLLTSKTSVDVRGSTTQLVSTLTRDCRRANGRSVMFSAEPVLEPRKGLSTNWIWVDQLGQQGGRAFSRNAEPLFQCIEDEPMSGLSRLDQRDLSLVVCLFKLRPPS